MIDKKTIKFVDGFKIRNTLDDDFTVLHDRSTSIVSFAPKFYIPEGEWWFDQVFKDELDFFIQVEEETDKLLETMEFEEAREKLNELLTIKGSVSPIEKEEMLTEGEIKTYLVDGAQVRKTLDPHFVFGGHDQVYSYIPKNEIWLDKHMDKEEIPYIYLHEKVERDLMAQGKNYDIAHEYATVADKEMRRNKAGGAYTGDANYPWSNLSDDEIRKKYYVS